MAEDAAALLSRLAESLLRGFEEDRRKTLRVALEDRASDVAVLREETDRLGQLLGRDDASVLELQGATHHLERLLTIERELAERPGSRPDVGPTQWMVTGRVTDRVGEPVAGMTVRFADVKGQFADALGSVKTDRQGEFFRVYDLRENADLFKSRPDITVEVLDAGGRSRFKSTDMLKVEPGAVTHFDIQIGAAQIPFGPPVGRTPNRERGEPTRPAPSRGGRTTEQRSSAE